MPRPEITLFKTPTADKIIQASKFALRLQEKTSKRGLLSPLEDRFLVRITVDVSGGKKLEAEEVYIDENGEAQTYASGLEFTVANNQPVFSANALSVGDIVEIKEAQRPDRTPYWLASAASGGGASASTRRLVKNKTLVLGAGGGTWVLIDAVDRGTLADEAALVSAYPTPNNNEYALVTATGTYWVASSGIWEDSSSATLNGAGIEGAWTTLHKSAVAYEIDCEADAYLWIESVNISGAQYWLANENFAVYRGEDQVVI